MGHGTHAVACPDHVHCCPGEPFYPQNHVGRGWGIRDGAMGAVRLPKILVLTIDDFVSAQDLVTYEDFTSGDAASAQKVVRCLLALAHACETADEWTYQGCAAPPRASCPSSTTTILGRFRAPLPKLQ